ncbi:MAG: ABC transporter permease [Gemmatimonadales bacterium]|nr:ABC transporter permease [Gemmatimonadales bacterium]
MAFESDSAGNNRLASYPTFQDWRAATNLFDGLAFARGFGTVMKTAAGAERLVTAYVTDEFFEVLPTRAAVGRTLIAGDWAPGAPAAVMLSHRLWQRRFGGDPAAVGRNIVLGDRSYTVVGVLPVDYGYPTWAELYAPITVILSTDRALQQRGLHTDSRIVGQLRAGVDTAAASRGLSAVAARLADSYPAESGGWRSVALFPVEAEVLGDTGAQLRLLTAAAVLVLLIACVNVANLSLARATTRSRELAIRTALGAGRGALLRLLAAESLLLGVAAGALGFGVAAWLTQVIRRLGRDLLPRVDEIAVAAAPLVVGVAVSVAAVIGFGLIPALRPSVGTLAGELKETAGSGTTRSRHRLRATLVVTEFALALMLLVGAGLLVRSMLRLQQVSVGFEPERLLAVPIDPPSPRYDDPGRALVLYHALADAAAGVPGVISVSLTNHVPLSGGSMPSRIEIDGAVSDREGAGEVLFRVIDTAYLRTAGVPLVAGRDFTADDVRSPGPAVLVNQTLAQRYWPGKNPIGQRITVFKSAQGRADFGEAVRSSVVGVVGDVRHYAPETEFVPEVYVPYTLAVWPRIALLVRVGADPGSTALLLQRAVQSVDPDIPLEGADLRSGVYQLTESLRDTFGYRRLVTGLLVAFASPAVFLAALGLYGVIAYLVSQRAHEIAIRMALGASEGSVLRLVLAHGLKLALLGGAIGAVGVLVGGRVLESQLYGVTSTDPVSLLGAGVMLTIVAVLATFLPARRAAKVQPMRALRAE